MITITTNQQIEDFTRGCCFFATGGGGDPLFGQQMLREALDAGKQICIIARGNTQILFTDATSSYAACS